VTPTSSPATALRTPFCDLLGIRYPIVQAPMAGGWTTPELVSEVSNAGGLGVLAGARVSPDRLREDIRAVKARTDRPFGVNFLLAPLEPGNRDVAATQRFLQRFREELGLPPAEEELALPPSPLPEQLEVVFEERVPVLSFASGDPTDLISEARASGARVLAMVTTVEEAVRVADGGADVIVAQGAEAGGHRSTFELGPDGEAPLVGTLALVPQVVDAVGVPVVAAGGISDGRGLVAALALGATGAQLGTRFLLARESGAFPAYRERLLAATETDTMVTRAFTGRPARSVRNRFVEEHLKEGAEPLAWPLQSIAAGDVYGEATRRGEADLVPLFAGQGLRMLDEVEDAVEIVRGLVEEAGSVLSRLRTLRLG
jgi:nitronate monooxygenase